tara:strand:- start:1241 stop:1480 length:240 start_codon:yes stop_codon:yes gene_type:complete
MLVLSGKVEERFRIRTDPSDPEKDIWLTVTDIRTQMLGDRGLIQQAKKVRLGFDAPREMDIARESLIPEEERPARKVCR